MAEEGVSFFRATKDTDALSIAIASQGEFCLEVGDVPCALASFEEALQIQRSEAHPNVAEVGKTLVSLANAERVANNWAASKAHAEEAVALLRKTLSPMHPALASALTALSLMEDDKKLAQAQAEEALTITRTAFGPENVRTAVALGMVARVLQLAGDIQGSCRRQEEAVAILRKVDRGDRHLLGGSLGILSNKQLLAGNASGAVASGRESLAILAVALAPDSPELAHAKNSLGSALVKSGAVEEGRAALREAAAIWQAGQRDPGEALLELTRIATSLRESGDVTSGRELLEEAVARSRSVEGPRHGFLLGFSLLNLGELERDAGNRDRAVTVLREAVSVVEADPPDPTWPIDFREILAAVLESKGEAKEAAELRARNAAAKAALAAPPPKPEEAAALTKAAETTAPTH